MQEIVINIIRTLNSCCVILLVPRRNSACAHIHSSHICCFLGFVSNTIYRWVMKYSWRIKKITVDVRYVFVSESQVWNKDHMAFLRLLCVFWWNEIYLAFAWCLWGFDIVLLAFSKSRTQQPGAHQSRYRARSSESCWNIYIDEVLDIYILIVKLKWWKKVEWLTWNCTRIEWMYKYVAYPRPWIYHSRSDLAISLHYSHL